MTDIRVLTNESNRICIAYNDDMIWVSYKSCIAYFKGPKLVHLGDDYNFSRTTTKHMNQFIGEFSGVYLEAEGIPGLGRYAYREGRIYLARLNRADRKLILDKYYEHQENHNIERTSNND